MWTSHNLCPPPPGPPDGRALSGGSVPSAGVLVGTPGHGGSLQAYQTARGEGGGANSRAVIVHRCGTEVRVQVWCRGEGTEVMVQVWCRGDGTGVV